MKRAVWLAAVAAGWANAAVIRGTVVENATGKALARAVVVLQPVEGTPGDMRSMRTTQFGGFEFDGLAGGAYVLKASRRGFLPMEYGQKRWNSAGMPVAIEAAETLFLNLRLPRFNAIAGRLVDENEIGLPNHDVMAYRTSAPPELAAEAVTDDRGIYRLYGLTPGTYVVRSMAKRYEEGSYGPTFSRETEKMDQARTVELFPEYEAKDVDVRPLPGRLYTLTISTSRFKPGRIFITMASDMVRKTMEGAGVQFPGLPPGDYELYAEGSIDLETGLAGESAYQRIILNDDKRVTLIAQPAGNLSVTGGPAGDSGNVLLRRRDLAGTGNVLKVPATRGIPLPTGRWEVMVQPPAGYYVSGLFAPARPSNRGRADGWIEIQSPGYARFTVADGPGVVRGVVKNSGDPVAGAPVYLEGWDPSDKKRVGELHSARTDMRGHYSFAELAPGAYRILSTFEYAAPDSAAMELCGAAVVTVEKHADTARDLDLYVIR
jgi:hypothetical protein